MDDSLNLGKAEDERLGKLLANVQGEISAYAQTVAQQVNRLAQIGIALSAEHDINKLLEMIVDEARHFTNADAGTLYMMENEKLVFRILQNETLKIRKGGTGDKVELPPVALLKTNVSAYVALTQESVNIADVYEAQGFDFTGPRKYDQATGYRSKSMLVVPMMNLDGEVIGVLQLLNAKDPKSGEVIAFAENFVALTRSMASQAAVSITNAKLITDMEALFEAFVSVMATAIDERSPYTAGHIRRVAELGALMCEIINKTHDGPFADVHFDGEKVKEMLMAGWLHDVGKITTPVHIVDKSTKLETIFDRIEILRHRFELIDACARGEMLDKKVAAMRNGGGDLAAFDAEFEAFRKKHWDDFDFITRSNKGGEFMDDSLIARIKEIGARTYRYNGADHRYLNENEVNNLCIRKGTLLDDERKMIQDHVVLTIRMLEKIPFTKKLSNIPLYAGTHHETLDGKGYPNGLKGDQIPLEGRILALVDIYEALTASDRPYKKGMPVEKAFAILKAEADHGKLDKDLLDLFIKANVHDIYLKMHPELAEGHKAIDAAPRAPGSTTAMAMDMIRRVLGTNMPDNLA